MKENNQIFDPIRGKNFSALPEEIIRQDLIHKMIYELNFPKSFIVVEKDLSLLPHLKRFKSSNRRADIICFAKNIHPKHEIYPLLMIECKAVKLTKAVKDQVLGYNHFVGAYFTAIANKYEIFTYYYDLKNKRYKSIDFLPKYDELINAVKKRKC